MKELTVTIYAGEKQTDKLTNEQCKYLSQKTSEAMSNYYGTHAAGNKKTEKEKENEKISSKRI